MRWIPLFVSLFLCSFLPTAGNAQSFSYADDCVTNVDNATAIIPETADLTLPTGASLEPADTLALRNDAGECVGYGVWKNNGSDLSIAAAGPTSVDEATSGYQSGDPLSFEVYDESESTVVELGEDVDYANCDTVAVPICKDDGKYANGSAHVVQALNKSSLPVKLANFNAERDGNRVLLEWTTAQETNNAGFEIQYKGTNADSTWEALRFVEGAGTTSETTSYTIKTDPLDVGTYQFRLRQVDQSGVGSLSAKKTVEIALDGPYRLKPVAPNPVRDEARFSVTVADPQQVTVTMYNVIGQRIATIYDRSVPANDRQDIQVRARNRSSGVYILRIEGEHFSDTQRMTIVR